MPERDEHGQFVGKPREFEVVVQWIIPERHVVVARSKQEACNLVCTQHPEPEGWSHLDWDWVGVTEISEPMAILIRELPTSKIVVSPKGEPDAKA